MPKTIFVVDDEPHILDFLREQLEDAQYTVYAAENAADAVALARKHKPDLIIMDIMIPDGGGVDIYHRMEKAAKISYIPGIFLSAAPIEVLKDQIAALKYGLFMQKPWNKAQLLANIRKMLEEPPPKQA